MTDNPSIKEQLREAVEQAMLKRIKLIGDNDQLYTGYPAQLIDEITESVELALRESQRAKLK